MRTVLKLTFNMYNKNVAMVIRGIIYTLGICIILSAITSCSKDPESRGNCDEVVQAQVYVYNTQWKRWDMSDWKIMDRCPCEEEIDLAIDYSKGKPLDQQYKVKCVTQ